MHEAIQRMLEPYDCQTRDAHTGALREILQHLALLGLWRGKFFEHAVFYGDTALRILHGLDRFSEYLGFSLLQPDSRFTLGDYGDALRRELGSFGFEVTFEAREKTRDSAIASAFLKANTLRQLIVVKAGTPILGAQHPQEILKIKLEVDTNPPPGFSTVSRTVLTPIPISVNAYDLPDLFAGKMHAVLCRKWKRRVKGRDWYDLAWYLARHPRLRLAHLEHRMRQSGDWTGSKPLRPGDLSGFLSRTIEQLDVRQARREVEPFARDPAALAIWSHAFFHGLVDRIDPV